MVASQMWRSILKEIGTVDKVASSENAYTSSGVLEGIQSAARTASQISLTST